MTAAAVTATRTLRIVDLLGKSGASRPGSEELDDARAPAVPVKRVSSTQARRAVLPDDTQAAWLVRTTGTHTGDGLGFPATGKSFETVAVNMGRFRDGVAVEHWSDQGLLSMLLQIGVMPPPGT